MQNEKSNTVDVKSSLAFVRLINHHLNQYRHTQDGKAIDVLNNLLDSAHKSSLINKDIPNIEAIYTGYGYNPYTGIAEPSDEQIKHNDQVFMAVLTDLAIPYTYVIHPDLDEDVYVVRVCRKVNEELYISYDRWGYCVEFRTRENSQPVMDQDSLHDVITFVATWYHCSEPIVNGEETNET